MNKDEILDALEDTRENFLDAIEGLDEDDLQEPGVNGEWSVKDILIHLSTWEAELVKLLWQARQGIQPTTVHFSSIDVDQQNEAWFEAYRHRPIGRVLADFEGVRKQTVRRVDSFSEVDLTNPERFNWLKGHPLWEWIAGDSFEHEAEHLEQIRYWRSQKEL